jgi:hypothetical protein
MAAAEKSISRRRRCGIPAALKRGCQSGTSSSIRWRGAFIAPDASQIAPPIKP